MKKIVNKKLFIILTTIFVLLISFELYCRSIVYKKYKDNIQSQINANKNFNGNLTYEKVIYPSYNERKSKFKPISIGKYKDKPSIVLFGCSFTWGSYLQENETFASVLSQYTGRTVYNRGLFGTGIPFMYFQLNDNNITNEIENPRYFIYTLIDNHFLRSLTLRSWIKEPVIQYKYKIVNNKLVLVKPVFTFLYSLYSVYLIQNYIQNSEYDRLLFKEPIIKMIDESYEIIKKKFPDSEFIILVYQDYSWKKRSYPLVKDEILKHFENEGIKVIYTNDLVGEYELADKKYVGPDGFHPSGEAWKLIVPKLVQVLNL